MLRIVYSPTEIITIITNDPSMGTTYTPFNTIVCTEQEALDFFAGYDQVQIDKLIAFIESGQGSGTSENVEV